MSRKTKKLVADKTSARLFLKKSADVLRANTGFAIISIITNIVVFGLLAILVCFIITVALLRKVVTQDTARQPSNTIREESSRQTKEITRVNLQEFVDEYISDKTAFEKKYENRIIETQGFVGNVKETSFWEYELTLNPKNNEPYFGISVLCYFSANDTLQKISKGQEISIRGNFEQQFWNTIFFSNCEIAQ